MSARGLLKSVADLQWPRRVAEKVELTLPLPPSVNGLYYNRTKRELGIAKAVGRPLPGRGKTERYKTWLRAAGNMVNAQRQGRIVGAYALTITIGADARIDLGNSEKALSDLLQEYGIVENDRKADSIFLSRSGNVARHECLVTISAAAEKRRTG